MKFTLLFTLITLTSTITTTNALPVNASRRPSTGFITLPLSSAYTAQSGKSKDLNPHLRLQQHLNSASRRLANHIKGYKIPSKEEMEKRMIKDVYALNLPHLIARNDAPECQTTNPPPECNDSLKLEIFANDVGYFTSIELGTPSRSFRVQVDSGSADLWVASENCLTRKESDTAFTIVGDCNPTSHPALGNKTSSSFVNMKESFEVRYGDGAHVEGTRVIDAFEFAGFRLPHLQFGVADFETEDLSDKESPFDGLMGLSRGDLSNLQAPTPIEALAASGLIDAPIVSYKLSRQNDRTDDGEITFGALDPSKFDKTTLTTLPNLSQSGFYAVQMDGVSVDGEDVDVLGSQGRIQALMDTGTTLLVVPKSDADKIHAAIGGKRLDGEDSPFVVPCDITSKVALVFGGRKFEIDPRDLIFAKVQDKTAGEVCLSGIGVGGEGGNWLVGDTFLKNVYFSTNAKTNEVSIAKLV